MKASKLDFLRIGSRSSTFKKLEVGELARLLNELIKAGLPVPAAILLLDGAWERMVADGIVEVIGDDVIVHSADEFMARFALNGVRKAVNLRLIFSAESQNQAQPPTHTNSNVPPATNPLIEAVVAIWQAGRTTNTRRDILIMERVTGQQQGSVISRAAQAFDLVETDDLHLPKLSRWQRSTQTVGWQRRLQLLLRGVRRTLSLETVQNWEIEWVDDGRTCWVVGIRLIGN